MFNFFKKTKRVVTHDGTFHADDVLAGAILSLYFKKNNIPFNITRTRQEAVIKKADYVFDVGGIYDEQKNYFDHHQKEGAGERQNGIMYAACGLVWKKFGLAICDGNEYIAKEIDRLIIQPVDAGDNGIDTSIPKFPDIGTFNYNVFIDFWRPISLDACPRLYNLGYRRAVCFMESFLKKTLARYKLQEDVNKYMSLVYNQSQDKKLVVVDKPFGRHAVTVGAIFLPEVLYVVYPNGTSCEWNIVCARKTMSSAENRKSLPKEWWGLSRQELAEKTGISDFLFCHRSGFLASTKTKQSAIELAKKAILL